MKLKHSTDYKAHPLKTPQCEWKVNEDRTFARSFFGGMEIIACIDDDTQQFDLTYLNMSSEKVFKTIDDAINAAPSFSISVLNHLQDIIKNNTKGEQV